MGPIFTEISFRGPPRTFPSEADHGFLEAYRREAMRPLRKTSPVAYTDISPYDHTSA